MGVLSMDRILLVRHTMSRTPLPAAVIQPQHMRFATDYASTSMILQSSTFVGYSLTAIDSETKWTCIERGLSNQVGGECGHCCRRQQCPHSPPKPLPEHLELCRNNMA